MAQDTQVKDEAEIIRAWQEAENAKEPGDSTKQKEIKIEGMPDGVGMRYSSLESAGWVYVYYQGRDDPAKTGERSIINKNMLPLQLQKKLPDGSRAFDIHPPKDKNGNVIMPKRGTIKCYLHPDDPQREHFNAMGFPTCRKANIPSVHARALHMAAKHKAEWATIKEEKERLGREEDRAFQRTLYERLTTSATSETKTDAQADIVCGVCGKPCKSEFGLKAHMRKHK